MVSNKASSASGAKGSSGAVTTADNSVSLLAVRTGARRADCARPAAAAGGLSVDEGAGGGASSGMGFTIPVLGIAAGLGLVEGASGGRCGVRIEDGESVCASLGDDRSGR